MRPLGGKLVVERQTLIELAEERWREAVVLRDAGHFQGSVYLAGYAVECLLKAVTCRTLDLDSLPETFKSHDLDLLLLHSGLKRRLETDKDVAESFQLICGVWKVEGNETLRYQSPASMSIGDADVFLRAVGDEKTGVMPWLRNHL